MSLQFVLGNSGAGKSYQLFQHIIEEAGKNPERKYLIIVPEQFTLQTQKELVRLSPRKGIMNIDILSFQRLAHRVFHELGEEQYTILEEIGKNMVLQRVIQEKGKELGVLAGSLKKTGTVSEMKSLVSELMQYDIKPEKLQEIMEDSKDKPVLFHKIKDIHLIYEGYVAYLRDRYITGEEYLEVLSERIQESKWMKNCEVILDGFTGFTPIQHKLLRELLRHAKKVWITVTLDENVSREKIKSPQHLFHMSGQMMEKVSHLAYEEKVEIEEEWWVHPGKESRFSHSPALEFLERHLFRYGNGRYQETQEEIGVFVANNPKDEMGEICRRIRQMVREKGYRYGDFAIITGDLDTYGTYARQTMRRCQIPYFIDEKHSVVMNPFIEYLRAVLQMLTEQFSYESVFAYLRCGLSDLTIHEVDVLENYCIAMGIRGWSQWEKPWIRVCQGMKEESILELNEIRKKFIDEIGILVEGMRERNLTVEQRTRILYEFIVHVNIQEKLNEKQKEFAEKGKQDLAKEYEQIFGIVIRLFEKMVEILGQEVVSMEEYRQVLEAGLQESTVGIIPPTADQVLVGDMERTRLQDIKVLFFAGVNDTCIPKRKNNSGLLSEVDRDYLETREVELAPNARASMYTQKFYLYLNLTHPTEKLYLSFAKTDRKGSAQGPAYLIPMISRMFPLMQICEVEELRVEELEQEIQGIPLLLSGFQKIKEGEVSDEWKELLRWYLSSPQWKEECEKWIAGAFHQKPVDKIGKEAARILYGLTLENSATQLERFAACAFAHFLQYGLKIRERQEYEFRAVDLGNVLHQALEQFSKNLKRNQLSWRDLSREKREEFIDLSVDEVIQDYGNTILESSARNQYMVTRLKRILRRTVWALQKQLQCGKFEPGRFEVSFATEDELEAIQFQLSEDEKIRLRGRIDRMDVYKDEETVYVKVIDYKSGNTKLDMVALYYGLQLQLVVYMNAAMEIQQKENPDAHIEPAGIFYYQVKDPLIEGEIEEGEENISARILQELKVNGLVREEKHILQSMDETLGAGQKSMVIPVGYKKNGELTSDSKVADKEKFLELGSYVNEKIKQIGQDILSGNVGIHPYKMQNRTACDYCDYKEICGFDERLAGYAYRKLPVFQDKEIWEKIKGKEAYRNGNELDEGTAAGH